MKVVKAEYNGPDSDGDINLELEVAIENTFQNVSSARHSQKSAY